LADPELESALRNQRGESPNRTRYASGPAPPDAPGNRNSPKGNGLVEEISAEVEVGIAVMDVIHIQMNHPKGPIRPKLRYAHQGGMNPPIIVIHGNSLEHVTDAYKRFLEGRFRKAFSLEGTPLRIEMKTSHNPYSDKDN